jgi:hypothetical protein
VLALEAGRKEREVKNSKWLLIAGMVIMLMTIGCQKQMGFVDDPQGGDVNIAATSKLPIQYNPGGSWFTYFLWTPPGGATYPLSIGNDAGGNGSVKLEKVGTNLIVTYQTIGDWYIQKTHVDVALTKSGLHHNRQNNLVPGHFLFQGPDQHIPYPQQVIMTIPWDPSWDNPATEGLYIAALANVCEGKKHEGGRCRGTYWCYWNWKTACGGNSRTDNPFKAFKLPSFPVTMTGRKLNQPRSYWDITLSGIGDQSQGYNVWDGQWNGWCAELAASWPGEGSPMSVYLYNSLDPNLPSRLQNPAWDNVSWLINEYAGDSPFYQDYEGPYSQGYFVYDMTQVIWYLLGDLPKPDWEPAQTMASRAETEGEGYIPHQGDYVAVICDAGPDVVSQLVFIEVDP